MPPINTPRPTAAYFLEEQTFSTKKERCTPRDNPPPRPPGKSCPPVSRVFSCMPSTRALLVSFKKSDSSVLSKHYDENCRLPYFDQCFEVISKLGSGSFADVFKVRSKDDGKYYAIKRSKERFKGKFDRQRKLEEVQKHEHLPRHNNCIRFYKAWEEKQYLYIQTEMCRTSLSQYAEVNHNIPEYVIWNYLVDLLLALKHLHDHNLVHLDIKPDNIFISEDGICKLGDFGLVVDLSKDDFSDAVEGDPKYLAAELMEGKFTKAADVFSLGITILELACDLNLPDGGYLWHLLRKGNIPSEFLSCLSPELIEVISMMMEPNHNSRPTVDQILQMKSITKVVRKRNLSLELMKSVVVKNRKLPFKMKSVASYFVSIYRLLLFCLCCLKAIVVYPYRHFKSNEKLVTPVRVARPHPPEWDLSFSDDDVFEDEIQTSLAMPITDSSSESRNSSFNSFTQPSIPGRQACTAPAGMCHWPNRNGPDPAGSPKLGWKRESPYMSSSPKWKVSSPFSSVRPDGLRASPALVIEPKNLIEAFDAELDDGD